MDEKKINEKKKELKRPKVIPKKVYITFRGNRKYDLHIGRNMITFRGRETKLVPAEWIEHKDFKQVEKLFIKKGA